MIPYTSYSELVLDAVKGVDYDVVVVNRAAPTTVVAIHGGLIEPLTAELASAVADADCNLYEFRALSAGNVERLRLPVNRFDDLRLRAMMEHSQEALALLGAPGMTPTVHLGGRNQTLKRALSQALDAAGFQVAGPATPGAAHDPRRFYNLPANGGVLLELARGLLSELAVGSRSERLCALVEAIRAGLAEYRVVLRDDVGRAMERFERDTQAMPPSVRRPHGHHEH